MEIKFLTRATYGDAGIVTCPSRAVESQVEQITLDTGGPMSPSAQLLAADRVRIFRVIAADLLGTQANRRYLYGVLALMLEHQLKRSGKGPERSLSGADSYVQFLRISCDQTSSLRCLEIAAASRMR